MANTRFVAVKIHRWQAAIHLDAGTCEQMDDCLVEITCYHVTVTVTVTIKGERFWDRQLIVLMCSSAHWEESPSTSGLNYQPEDWHIGESATFWLGARCDN